MFIVTGGSRGIGKALAHALAMRQQRVLIIGRQVQTLMEVAKFSPLIDYVCADVSSDEGRQTILAHVKDIPTISGLIHNAGVVEPMSPISSLDSQGWRQVLATNLDAPLFLSQLLLDKLDKGRVLHIGSGAAYIPITGWAAYCVSKAGLAMLTRCWQLECENVAFASVMPGIIDTEMQAQIRNASCMDPQKNEFFKRLYREHRLVSPETVAIFLCWLLLDMDKSRYCSEEWDIYDQTHHHEWLTPPHTVPSME